MVFFVLSGSTNCYLVKRVSNRLLWSTVFLFFVLISCSSDKEPIDIPQTATSGVLKVAVDEGFWPIISQEKSVFEFHYKYATVQQFRTTQEEAISLLIKDSVRFVVAARELNESELAFLESKKVFPKTYVFAQDGITFLANKSFIDTVLSLDKLKNIALGKEKGIHLVFDRNASGTIYSFIKMLQLETGKLEGVYSLDSVETMVDHVANHPDAIGVMGSSWVSEQESKKVQTWLEKTKIMKISGEDGIGYLPFQSEMADSLYPLTRKIYLISRESQMGLANGYAAFLLGEKGQRILLKSGLLPYKIPPREVVVSKKSY
jgi:phosphate transport system substrate-binding protein